jgi:hypothetical protein
MEPESLGPRRHVIVNVHHVGDGALTAKDEDADSGKDGT